MSNINKVSLSGNLTRDPELKRTGSTSVLEMTIAVNERRKNRHTGQYEDAPGFFDCVMFGSRAENLANMLSKGMKIAVTGKLRYENWTSQDGTRHSRVKISVDDLDFIAKRQTAQEPSAPTVYQQPSLASPAPVVQHAMQYGSVAQDQPHNVTPAYTPDPRGQATPPQGPAGGYMY